MIKAKTFNWKDTNVSEIGSEADKNARKEAAKTEKAWKNAGKNKGLTIWRINKFQVEDVPKDDYGKFFSGDSYIILNTKLDDSGAKTHDIHFWIGTYSSQDEYGTAAYKTVELSDFLTEATKQFREVQGEESDTFRKYFTEIIVLNGGYQSGFRHVDEKKYTPRLLIYEGENKKQRILSQIPFPDTIEKLKEDRVYIIDNGLKLYQYFGNKCNKDDRIKSAQFIQILKSERGKAENTVIEQSTISAQEKKTLNDTIFKIVYKSDTNKLDMEKERRQSYDDKAQIEIFKMVIEKNTNKVTRTKENNGEKNPKSNCFYVYDFPKEVIVWCGKDVNKEENFLLLYGNLQVFNSKYPKRAVKVLFEKNDLDRKYFNELVKKIK